MEVKGRQAYADRSPARMQQKTRRSPTNREAEAKAAPEEKDSPAAATANQPAPGFGVASQAVPGRRAPHGVRKSRGGAALAAARSSAGAAAKATLVMPDAPRGPVPAPARSWHDVAEEAVAKPRDQFRVAPEAVTVHAAAAALPQAPRESAGLFELVSPVARRALDLGLAARETSFNVFVAAEPVVMVEEDIVRYARRFSSGRPPPPDIVYVHDFDHPEAPRPLLLPAGVGPSLVAAMNALIDKLREEMPAIAEAEDVRAAQAKLSQELEARGKAILHDLESAARTLGFGIRSVQGGVQTVPILHGKPLSAEQFDVLDESTKRALADAEGKLTREVEKAAQLVR